MRDLAISTTQREDPAADRRFRMSGLEVVASVTFAGWREMRAPCLRNKIVSAVEKLLA